MSQQQARGTSQRPHTVASIPAPVVTLHYGPTQVRAPASLVFEVLSDVSTWSSWNSFVPQCDIVAQPEEARNYGHRDNSTKLQEGTRMRFHVVMGLVRLRMPYVVNRVSSPTDCPEQTVAQQGMSTPGRNERDMYVINWKKPSFRDSWIPSWLIQFERTHEIRILADDLCEVETWDCQAGPSAYFVKWLLKGRLDKEFGKWVEGLREYCEERHGERNGPPT